MIRHVTHTEEAPRAIGPYSQGLTCGNMVFLSGQIGLDPRTGQLVAGGTEAETERVMQNLGAVLKAEGLTFDDVVRTTIYLLNIGDFAVVNDVYSRFLRPPFPARATVGVAALPRGAHVEIDAIAMRK